MIGVPLLRDGEAIGAIGITREKPEGFSDRDIALLGAFADQAVIAIENVRLFTELEARNRDLTDALARQTATAEVLRVIGSSPTDVQPVFDAIVRSAMHLLGGHSSAVYQVIGDEVHLAAYTSTSPSGDAALASIFPRPLAVFSFPGEAIHSRAPFAVSDIATDPRQSIEQRRHIRERGTRSGVWVPMLREGVAIGAISVTRSEVGAFADDKVALLQTFADQAVIAIENVRLFKALEAKNRDLTEALEQQTATGEVLKVISRSAFDLGPVFETVVESAVRLCEADRAFIYRFDGEVLRMAVAHNVSPEMRAFVAQNPHRPGRQSAAARTALERRTVHIPDALADPELTYGATQVEPVRTLLAVPMLKGEELVGVILIYRLEFRPFTAKQIALMQTFADQAVIAVENVRLFTELEARNRDLTDALARQTATAEVLRVISSSQTDIQPVFAAILDCAVRLCAADLGHIFAVEDGQLVPIQLKPSTPEAWAVIREVFPRPVDTTSLTGRAVVEARVVHVPDIDDPFRPAGPDERVEGARLPRPALGAHPPRWSADRGSLARPASARSLLRRPNRPRPDLRRSGRHRHRERAPPERAAGA